MQILIKSRLALILSGTAMLLYQGCAVGDPSDTSYQITQVVSFGDSLSDVGTYAYARRFGGGVYTTNPGTISVQNIAAHYNTVIAPALTGGFGEPSVSHPGGFGYAQGGARVANAPNPDGAPEDTGELQTSITAQLAAYLKDHGSFNKHQLVLIQGGANDIQDAYNNWATLVTRGADPVATMAQITPSLQQIAKQLAWQVQVMLKHGAAHIVLQNVPDISKAPIGALTEQTLPGSAQLLRQLTQVFNTELAHTLPASPALLQVDMFAFFDQTTASYKKLGFQFDGSVATNVACVPAQLPAAYVSDSNNALFCQPKYYVTSKADKIYMFADAYHPSTHLQKLISDYVVSRIDTWLAHR